MTLLPIEFQSDFDFIKNSHDPAKGLKLLVNHANILNNQRIIYSIALAILSVIVTLLTTQQFSLSPRLSIAIAVVVSIGSGFLYYRLTKPITFEAKL